MPRSLASRDQRGGDRADLGHAAGRAVDLGVAMVCTESTTSSAGLHRVEVPEHRAQVGLGGEVELVVQGADPLGPQPHLAGRLLTGDVERAVRRVAPTAGRRRAAASTCRRPARRRAARRRRARGRRRAPGRARRRRSGGRWPASTSEPRRSACAGDDTGPARDRGRPSAPPTSATVPHAWHSPQRPIQRAVVQPHSEHANDVALLLVCPAVFAMPNNLSETADKSRQRAKWSRMRLRLRVSQLTATWCPASSVTTGGAATSRAASRYLVRISLSDVRNSALCSSNSPRSAAGRPRLPPSQGVEDIARGLRVRRPRRRGVRRAATSASPRADCAASTPATPVSSRACA